MSDPGRAPLAVAVPEQQNPFDTLGRFADVQQKLNQNRLFQQTFAARQAAGRILANAPSLDEGLAQLQSDPLTAPFAPEIADNVRSSIATLTSVAGARQEQARSGFDALLKSLPAVMEDPGSWGKVTKSVLGTLSPSARASVAPIVKDIGEALTDGLPSDPAARRLEFQQRVAGMYLAGGGTPEVLRGVYGTPGTQELGGYVQPTLQAPPQAGGGLFPSGAPFQRTPGPALVPTPGGAAVPFYGAMPRGAAATGGNPFMPSQPAGAAGEGTSLGRPAGGAGGRGATVEPAGTLASDAAAAGAAAAAKAPGRGTGVAGIPVMNQAEASQAKNMMDEFSTSGVREFNAAQQSLGFLRQMDQDLDTLAKGGGMLTPGGAADLRLTLARGLNTIAQGAGGKPLIDPEKVAAGENANKITNTLGFNLVNQFLGGQREAYNTIEKSIQSVPGIGNSYLGGKLLTESLRQTAQRAIDQREFQQAWADRRGGDLSGSIEAFNKQFPPQMYAERALKSFGMTEKGFDSPQAVKGAVKQGYLTPEQGVKILTSQFGGTGPKKGK